MGLFYKVACDLWVNSDRLLVIIAQGENYTYRQPVPEGAIQKGNSSTIFKGGLARWGNTLYWLTLHQSSATLNTQLWHSQDNGRHFTSAWTKQVCDNCTQQEPKGSAEEGEESRLRATIAVSGDGAGVFLLMLVDAAGTSYLLRHKKVTTQSLKLDDGDSEPDDGGITLADEDNRMPQSCRTALEAACSTDPQKKKARSPFASKKTCGVCAGQMQHRLREAGCDAADIMWYCEGGMSPASGLQQVAAIKTDRWWWAGSAAKTPDLAWIQWLLVSEADTRTEFSMPPPHGFYPSGLSYTDDLRQAVMDEYDPDLIDEWSGGTSNRAYFYTSRGVATNMQFDYEYQQALNGIEGFVDSVYRTLGPGPVGSYDNGVSVKEDGASEYSGYHSYTMDPLATRWHASLTASFARAGGFNDALFQDNLVNNLWSDNGGFSDHDNELFVAYAQERFSVAKLTVLGFPKNVSTFRLRDHMAAVRKTCHDAEAVISDALIHEYTRWVHVQSMLNAVHSAEAMKAAAVAQNDGAGSATVFYGNLPNAGGLHASVVMMAASAVDLIWSEQSEDFQPGFQDDRDPGRSTESKAAPGRQAYTTLVYKLAQAAGGFVKPVITLEYVGIHYQDPLYPGVATASKILPEAVYLAETVANGGIACQTDVATPWKTLFPPPAGNGGPGMEPLGWPSPAMKPHRDLNSFHAQFLHRNRGLFIDRSRVARFALVYSLPSMLWRDWAPLRTPSLPHREHFTAAARLLEDRRILYEVIAFGHDDFMDSNASLARLADGRYSSLLLPAVDAISDEHVEAITSWVRGGGQLIVWHNESGSGLRDEEMRLRPSPAFAGLKADPGRGKVVVLNAPTVSAYVIGVSGNSGDTLAAAMGEAPRQKQLDVVETATGKQASPLVWANLWRHGSGPMLSIQLVNYDVDTTGRLDAVNATPPFTVRLDISAETGLTAHMEARWVSLDYCNVSMPHAGLLNCGTPPLPDHDLAPVITASGLLEIKIPPVQIFGAIVITNARSAERATRVAAAEARKWLTRLSFATTRTPGANRTATASIIADAHELVDSVQGISPNRGPSAALVDQLEETASSLQAAVSVSSRRHSQRRAAVMTRTAATPAQSSVTARFYDFTGGVAPSPPGWAAVSLAALGKGWSLECKGTANNSIAAGGSREPLTNVESLFGEWIRNRDPALPYRYGDGRSSGQFRLSLGLQPQLSPATFRMDGLASGDYTVTVVTGSNGAFPVWEGPSIEARTAMTQIEILEATGAAEMVSVGDRLHAGEHQFRSFPARVSDGLLTLRFSGSSVGPLYYNSIQWMVSAVMLQRQGDTLLPQTEAALAAASRRSAGALRSWRVLAPLGGNDRWDALDTPSPLETQASPDFGQQYPSKLGGRIGWRNASLTSFAAVLPLMDGPPSNDSVGFAYAEHVQPRAGPAQLVFSTSGVGKVFLNNALVARDELDAGLLAAEQTVAVQLLAGTNRVLIKSVNNWGFADWAVHASIVSASAPKVNDAEPPARGRIALKADDLAPDPAAIFHANGDNGPPTCSSSAAGVSWTGATQLAYQASCSTASCCCAACAEHSGCAKWMTIDGKHGATHPGCYLFGSGGKPDAKAWPGYTTGPLAPHPPPPVTPSGSIYDELWRPRFHYFASPHIMDPAAIFESNGIWHLFHDWESPAEIPQWSHATSPDAVHWQKHPIAIPFGVKGACDEGFAETGGVGVREDGVAVALYAGGTRHSGSGPGRSGTSCNICASISTDAAHMKWTKVKEPVVPNLNNGSDWRDSTRPFRMPGDTENWWMIVGTSGAYGGTPTAAKAALFVNSDGTMLHWEPAGTFFEDKSFLMMECPDAFPLSNRSDSDAPFFFMSSATVGKGYAVGAHWWVGRVNRSDPERPRFMPEFDGIWDYGAQDARDPEMAATPTYTSTKSGPFVGGWPRYIFSWVRGDGAFGTVWWRQHMTFNGVSAFPRAIAVTESRALRQSFIPAVASLRVPSTSVLVISRCLAPQSSPACDAALELACGSSRVQPPVPFIFACADCAGEASSTLRAAGCENDGIARWCSGLSSTRTELPLEVHGRAQEIMATFGPRGGGNVACLPAAGASFGFSVFAACNDTAMGRRCEETLVGYTRAKGSVAGYLFVDRTNSSTFAMGLSKAMPIQRAPLALALDGTMTLHILLDYSIVEVIADNGTHSAAITSRVYPLFNSSDGVPKLWSNGAGQWLVSLTASQLSSISSVESGSLKKQALKSDDVTITAGSLTLILGQDGGVEKVDISGQDLLCGPSGQTKLMSATVSDHRVNATALTCTLTGGELTVSLASVATVHAHVNATDGFLLLTIVSVTGTNVSGLTFSNIPVNSPMFAPSAAAAYGAASSVLILPATMSVDVSASQHGVGCTMLSARSYAADGLAQAVVIWGGGSGVGRLAGAIEKGEKEFGLPNPTIGGVWAKQSPALQKGYFLMSVDPTTLNQTIEFALQSGLPYITMLVGSWTSSQGHYNVSSVWGGMEGMKAAVLQTKSNGLKVGIHSLSANIATHDSYVSPIPDPRLAKQGGLTLDADVSPTSTWLPLQQIPNNVPNPYGVLAPVGGLDVTIDSEICTYSHGNSSAPFGLGGVKRGAYGTGCCGTQAGGDSLLHAAIRRWLLARS